MLNDILSEAWQPRTDYEQYEQTWIAPKTNNPAQPQDGYQHQPLDSGDSRHFVPDTHPEDTWN